MTPAEILADALGRVLENGVAAVDGLSEDELAWRPGPDANPIAWLVWHSARQQDAQISDLAGQPQVWTAGGWCDRFGLDLPPGAHGYGFTTGQVGKVRASADLLAGYLRAAHAEAVAYVQGIEASQLDEVIDHSWDPPVTRGVRLVSIVDDGAQHTGQAAYVRGLLGR